jgi:hypothetical protein
MKRILLLFLFLSISLISFSQEILNENFDASTSLPTGWTKFRGTNNLGTVNDWFIPTTVSHSPSNSAAVAYENVSGGIAEDWLVTPLINLAGNINTVLNFYAAQTYGTNYGSNYYVKVSTTSQTSHASFTTVASWTELNLTTGADASGFAFKTVDLNAYNGQQIYIAFIMTNDDGDNFIIDDVVVRNIVSLDAEMYSININSTVQSGTVAVSGTIRNAGSNTITTADVNWQVDGGSVQTESLTGLNIASNTNYNFNLTGTWNATPGAHTMNMWLTNINGGTDLVTDNNDKSKEILVVNEVYPQTVVYEEGTGTWCGWCTRGLVGLNTMAHNYTDGSWIGIAVHNGDPMVVTAYDDGLGISSFPSGYINRKVEADPGLDDLETAYLNEKNNSVPVGKVEIVSQTWNSTSRELSYTVESKFALDIPSANFKLSGIVVEDGVTGTTTAYNQANYYSGGTYGPMLDWDGTDYAALPSTVPAAQMIYNHVGRAIIGDFTGIAGSVPATLVYNTPYSYTFNYTLPAANNAENIKLVAMILNQNGEIVNADEVELSTIVGFDDLENDLAFNFNPNPAKEEIRISTLEEVSIVIYDLTGKVVMRKNNVENNTTINISNLETGVYLINASNGASYRNLKFVKE